MAWIIERIGSEYRVLKGEGRCLLQGKHGHIFVGPDPLSRSAMFPDYPSARFSSFEDAQKAIIDIEARSIAAKRIKDSLQTIWEPNPDAIEARVREMVKGAE